MRKSISTQFSDDRQVPQRCPLTPEAAVPDSDSSQRRICRRPARARQRTGAWSIRKPLTLERWAGVSSICAAPLRAVHRLNRNITSICPAGLALYRNGFSVGVKGMRGGRFQGPKCACIPCTRQLVFCGLPSDSPQSMRSHSRFDNC